MQQHGALSRDSEEIKITCVVFQWGNSDAPAAKRHASSNSHKDYKHIDYKKSKNKR